MKPYYNFFLIRNFYFSYLLRFNDELDQIRNKNSIGKRLIGQHFNREKSILITVEKEKNEYDTSGIGWFKKFSA